MVISLEILSNHSREPNVRETDLMLTYFNHVFSPPPAAWL
jgi:hypothetical protein